MVSSDGGPPSEAASTSEGGTPFEKLARDLLNVMPWEFSWTAHWRRGGSAQTAGATVRTIVRADFASGVRDFDVPPMYRETR
jgi:hypothetical protein